MYSLFLNHRQYYRTLADIADFYYYYTIVYGILEQNKLLFLHQNNSQQTSWLITIAVICYTLGLYRVVK